MILGWFYLGGMRLRPFARFDSNSSTDGTGHVIGSSVLIEQAQLTTPVGCPEREIGPSV
jgi:hypothetical protein